jgi:hypothetical protein
LALSLALAPATANGAETLAQRVLKEDAKYLAVKELKPIDTAPKIETGEEEGGANAKNALDRAGSDQGDSQLLGRQKRAGPGNPRPVVTVLADG